MVIVWMIISTKRRTLFPDSHLIAMRSAILVILKPFHMREHLNDHSSLFTNQPKLYVRTDIHVEHGSTDWDNSPSSYYMTG